MRSLVTGAAGFIGSTLVGALLDRGDEVVGVDSLTDYYDVARKCENLEAVQDPRFRFVRADLAEADLAELLDGVQDVFHLAGQPGVRASWGAQFGAYVQHNVAATQILLEACAERPLRRMVFASSSSVYGDAVEVPTPEHAPLTPISPYGVSKLAAEHLCRVYASERGVPVTMLRIFTAFGPRQRDDMAFTRFIDAAVRGLPIRVHGDGTQVRDFTFVDDVVRAFLAASETPVAPGSVFNVGGGSGSSVNEVLDILERLVGRPLEVVRTDSVLGDVRRTGADVTAAARTLGWRPQVGLADGLAAQLAARVM